MGRALQTVRTPGASIVLANDSEVDKFGAADLLASDGMARVFTADELAALFVDWVMSRLVERQLGLHEISRYAVVIRKNFSKLLTSTAWRRGFPVHEGMTGFRWLNKTVGEVERSLGKTVLLLYGEAIGYNVVRNVMRDKYGVSAAVMFYEMVTSICASKTTMVDCRPEIIDKCGVHFQTIVPVSDDKSDIRRRALG